ncbi:hypothetical protein AN958_00221 [Leucoagaricus sp. SymC.cos]|nr:hypothetical protein AN958_00777 [Leucoagaricus sp. SymC.cos]KXN93297.1 hypothetical protein AN958_00221 [Leucoagaricus sp. SymC.cos]
MKSTVAKASFYLCGGALLTLVAFVTYDRLFVIIKGLTFRAEKAKTAIERKIPTTASAPTKSLTQSLRCAPREHGNEPPMMAASESFLTKNSSFPVFMPPRVKADNQVYVFIDSEDLSDPRHIRTLADGLADYLPKACSLGPNASLVLLAKQNPNSYTVEEYQTLFWKLLDGVARIDKKP